MFYTAYGLARSYSCGIVGVGVIAVRSQTSYMRPRKSLTFIRRRIAECIVADTLTVVRSKLILPAGRGISISILFLARADAAVRRKAVGAFLQDIAAYVIRPSVRLVRLVVILTDKSVESVVVILGKK